VSGISGRSSAGDLAQAAVPKIRASLERGIADCDSTLNAISLGASERSCYRGVLLCRMEAQYTIAMLKYCMTLEPESPRSRISVSLPGDLERVLRLLQEALDSLQAGDYEHSARSVVDADRLLGHMVAKLRRRAPSKQATAERKGAAEDAAERSEVDLGAEGLEDAP